MAETLNIEKREEGYFVDLRQMAGRDAKGEIFCQNCCQTQKAFKPISLNANKSKKLEYLFPPMGFVMSSFCAVCGWILKRGHITRKLREQVYLLDGYECVYCGRRMRHGDDALTLDHVIPVSKGGTESIDNLVTCCENCNPSKGNRDNFLPAIYGRFDPAKKEPKP